MLGNTLYYGDNLEVLREHIRDDSVDLIYLDPPFKSNQDYNVLFREQDDSRSVAQIKAFRDTWQWDQNCCRSLSGGSRSRGPGLPGYASIPHLPWPVRRACLLKYDGAASPGIASCLETNG